jgi:hypothetical protein
MAPRIDNDTRDLLITEFREAVCEQMEVAPFLHQRAVWCASDGVELDGTEDANGLAIRNPDGTVIRAGYRPRPEGRARFLADLGAFKIGKSFGAALWASGFAAVPGARVNLVGLEYDICEPEFTYLIEFLLSERGMNLKADSVQNRPRDGKMHLDMSNGCQFTARSWERKDTLKGKEIDAYVYCEAYQLPGIECFTSFSQNLRARRGYAYFATTPDRPWIEQLHQMGHGFDPEWHCTCSIGAEVNPFTFDAKAKERDSLLMTREKFEIHYNGRMGKFVGQVFPYQRGDRVFDHVSTPDLFPNGVTSRETLRVPQNWELVSGADTGTHYSGLTVAFDPDGNAFVLEEFPNYRYVAGYIERDETLTIPSWCRSTASRIRQLGGRADFWADPNTQFKNEMRNYGVTLLPEKSMKETRTEITREYFQHGRIFLAPWLTVLPFELENAAWPEEASLSGKFERVKDRDHTLDCLEHILARRPFGKVAETSKPKGSWAAAQGFRKRSNAGNAHLGRF